MVLVVQALAWQEKVAKVMQLDKVDPMVQF
jgi:hypothetical protein